jgi:shikimate kinase
MKPIATAAANAPAIVPSARSRPLIVVAAALAWVTVNAVIPDHMGLSRSSAIAASTASAQAMPVTTARRRRGPSQAKPRMSAARAAQNSDQ